MIFIVLCHIIKYYSFIPGHEFLGTLFGSGVYLFLFVSGFLYAAKNIGSFKKWYVKRFTYVSVPAIITAVCTITALVAVGESVSLKSFFAYLFDLEGLLFINWDFTQAHLFEEVKSLGPLWFTTIIMLCYLFVPLLERIRDSAKARKKTAEISAALCIAGLLSFAFLSGRFTLDYLVTFISGYFFSFMDCEQKITFKSFSLYTAFTAAVFAVKFYAKAKFRQCFFYTGLSTFALALFGVWIVLLFFLFQNKTPKFTQTLSQSKIMQTLDGYTFYIYLTHGVFCMGTFNLYLKFSLLPSTLLFLLSTVLSATILKLICRYISKGMNRLLKMS